MRVPVYVWPLIFFLALQLTGCGFHLRGSAQIRQNWNPVYVEKGELKHDQLSRISRALTRASARISKQRDSSSRLSVTLHPPESRLLAGSSTAAIELRQLSMQLDYSLRDERGESLVEHRQIVHSAEIELDTGNLLANQALIEQAVDRLEQDLIRSMIFQLGHQ